MLLLNEEFQVLYKDEKTNISFPFTVPEGAVSLKISFSYDPKLLEDGDRARILIENNIKKDAGDYADQYPDWKEYLPLKNLITLSLDDAKGYRGCAHRQDKEQIHIICHATDQVSHRAEVRAGKPAMEEMYLLCEEIYEDVLCRLEKNPKLKITLAHFFFMGEELPRLSAVLDKYPNVCIDTTPAERELHYLSETPEETRAFFRKYADRIMLGTDDKNAFHEEYKKVQLAMLDRWLRSPDRFTTKWGNKLVGVDLDRETLEKVLYKNFKRRTGEAPKVMDKALLKAYIEKTLPLIVECTTKEEIKKFKETL